MADTRRGSGVAISEDAAKAAHERRREQIRRAQRTHRERREVYLRNLESEVVMLREKDASHEQLVIALKRKISDLNQIMIANGIPIPSGLVHIESPQTMIDVQMQADGVQNVRAIMPTLTNIQSQSRSQSNTLPSTTTVSNTDMSDLEGSYNKMVFANDSQDPPQTGRTSANTHRKGLQHDLDATQTALDFVLDLERPCLSHHGPEVHNGVWSGHKLMVQTPIMAHSNTPRSIYNLKAGEELPGSASWTVPAVEVERLLNLSTRLSLEGEITPIEAWQKIKQHPGFATLNPERLKQLKAVLLPEVQCYGFGAVIDEQYFNFLVEQHFSTSDADFQTLA